MFKGSLLVSLMLVSLSVADRQIIVWNKIGSTLYVGTLGYDGKPAPNNGGFALNDRQNVTINVTDDWVGRFWGRTGCNFDKNGAGPCVTGDCGNKLQCGGDKGVPPATLAEFNFGISGRKDYYDISVVEGYNLPLAIAAFNGQSTGDARLSCTQTVCSGINDDCPPEYQVQNGGQVVGCKSGCDPDKPRDCCIDLIDEEDECEHTSTSDYFKGECLNAITYAYDEINNKFECTNAVYELIFE